MIPDTAHLRASIESGQLNATMTTTTTTTASTDIGNVGAKREIENTQLKTTEPVPKQSNKTPVSHSQLINPPVAR